VDRRARIAIITVVALSLVYAAAAVLAVPGAVKSLEMARHSHQSKWAVAPTISPSYLFGGIWLRFDTVWYLDIASEGYQDPHGVVFYPLYPMLIRALSWLGLPPLAAALIVSRFALVFLLWGLLLLLEMDLTVREARIATALMLVWPSGFMLFAAYPDSLMLALVVWAFWLARNQRWWPAALCAALASATKAAGAAAVLGLIVMCIRDRQWRPGPLGVAGAGVMLYPAALWISGLPQPAQMYSQYWLTTPSWPWDTLWAALRGAVQGGDAVLRFDLFFLLLVSFVVWRQRIHPAYAVYSAALLLLFLTKKTDPLLQSTMRYLLAVFPLFAGLARVPRDPYGLVAIASLFLLFHGVFLFAFWMWSLVV